MHGPETDAIGTFQCIWMGGASSVPVIFSLLGISIIVPFSWGVLSDPSLPTVHFATCKVHRIIKQYS